MKLVVQRVRSAAVDVAEQRVAQIGAGLLVLVGVSQGDTVADAVYLAHKTVHLRVFDDAEGVMNRSVCDVGGGVLAVSQFTLCGDCTRGNRPSYRAAARPELGRALYEEYVRQLRVRTELVETGVFRAEMAVHLVNDGPVTLILESAGRQ